MGLSEQNVIDSYVVNLYLQQNQKDSEPPTLSPLSPIALYKSQSSELPQEYWILKFQLNWLPQASTPSIWQCNEVKYDFIHTA